MNIASIRDIATILGVFAGATALAFTAVNTLMTMRPNRAKFWLDLRAAFSRHDDVHRALRPGGKWTALRRALRPGGKWIASDSGPTTTGEWADVEAYMGLFEHCESCCTKS